MNVHGWERRLVFKENLTQQRKRAIVASPVCTKKKALIGVHSFEMIENAGARKESERQRVLFLHFFSHHGFQNGKRKVRERVGDQKKKQEHQ